jgi:hypothetical protein
LVTQKTGVIVGALNFNSTEHDSKTLPLAIEQHKRLTGITAKQIFLDRGYRGPKKIEDTLIQVPVTEHYSLKKKTTSKKSGNRTSNRASKTKLWTRSQFFKRRKWRPNQCSVSGSSNEL